MNRIIKIGSLALLSATLLGSCFDQLKPDNALYLSLYNELAATKEFHTPVGSLPFKVSGKKMKLETDYQYHLYIEESTKDFTSIAVLLLESSLEVTDVPKNVPAIAYVDCPLGLTSDKNKVTAKIKAGYNFSYSFGTDKLAFKVAFNSNEGNYRFYFDDFKLVTSFE